MIDVPSYVQDASNEFAGASIKDLLTMYFGSGDCRKFWHKAANVHTCSTGERGEQTRLKNNS